MGTVPGLQMKDKKTQGNWGDNLIFKKPCNFKKTFLILTCPIKDLDVGWTLH
jgi:hypothetical protein